MKCFTTLLILISFFSISTFFAQITIMDNDKNKLLLFNDEGKIGSITIPSAEDKPNVIDNKLYNVEGFLLWNGNTLLTENNLNCGWIDDGSIVRLRSASDKVGIGTSSPISSLQVTGNDGVVFGGTYDNGLTLNVGPGVNMLWYPKKAAFRSGRVNGTQWNDANIGSYSIAMGRDVIASGFYSCSIGNNSIAGNDYTISMGNNTNATGYNAMSLGYYSNASGHYSLAAGYHANAESFASIAMGRYNIGGGNIAVWNEFDPIFEIGIGNSEAERKNALTVIKNGRTGLGIADPEATLHVDGKDGVLFEGERGLGQSVDFDAGDYMFWYPKKAAFRVGSISNFGWDDADIGISSIAMGNSPKAKGENSIALGNYATALGDNSAALGYVATSRVEETIAIGSGAKANHIGSVVISADIHSSSSDTVSSSANGQLVLYASEGMVFTRNHGSVPHDATKYINTFTGAYLSVGGVWTNASDKNLKENFKAVNNDKVLDKVNKLQVSEWNYKSEEDNVRHIGPTAQDFYKIFELGNNNTSIAPSDLASIAIVAVQALESKAKEQESKIKELEGIINLQKTKNSELEMRLNNLESKLNSKRFTSAENNNLIGN